MIAWRGAGILVFLFGAAGFFAVALGFDGPAKGTLYPWSLAALGVGAVTLPLGWYLNRRRTSENTHDFMFIPMQYWGGLLLLGGVGMIGAHFAMEGGVDEEADPCAELSEVLSSCTDPGAVMMGVFCVGQERSVQEACLSCVQSSTDPCSPGGCRDACGM